MSDIITDFFVENKIISDSEKSVYKYGTEVTISTITGIILILLIGTLMGRIFESVIFLLCFITVRCYSGGYHADTYIKCNLTFISVFVAVMLAERIISSYFEIWVSIILLICSFMTIALLAPIENKHKPLYGSEKKKYKMISIGASFLWGMISVILFLIGAGANILNFISLTMFSIAILMIVEKIKQKILKIREENSYDEK